MANISPEIFPTPWKKETNVNNNAPPKDHMLVLVYIHCNSLLEYGGNSITQLYPGLLDEYKKTVFSANQNFLEVGETIDQIFREFYSLELIKSQPPQINNLFQHIESNFPLFWKLFEMMKGSLGTTNSNENQYFQQFQNIKTLFNELDKKLDKIIFRTSDNYY